MKRASTIGCVVAAVGLVAVATASAGGADSAGGASAGVPSAPTLPGSIAYSAGSQHNAVPYQVYLAQPDGSITQLTHTARGAFPAWPGQAWSPDGSRMLVAHDGGLYVVRADDSSEIHVVDGNGPARWSPDGRGIAFQDGSSLYLVDADGNSDPRLLSARVSDSYGIDVAWSWSPDGRQIVYAGTDAKTRSALFLVNAQGTPRPKKIAMRPQPSNPSGARVYHPPSYRLATWSPDGSRIAFQWDDGRAKCCQNDWIYVMRPDGSGVTRLHRGNIRAWSPDGRKIAFAEGIINDWSLSVVNADGTNLRRLHCRHKCSNPTWFPDGTRLGYTNRDGQEIVVARSDGSGRRIVAHYGGAFSLSPDGSTIAYVAGKRPNSNRYLYVVGADGSGRRLVAHSSTLRFWAPTWRPISHGRARDANHEGSTS